MKISETSGETYFPGKHKKVTGFWKTDQIVTPALFHFIAPANSYTHTLPMHSAITIATAN